MTLSVRNTIARMLPLHWEMRRRFRRPTGEPGEPYYIEWSGAPRPRGEGWDRAAFDGDGVLLTYGTRRPVAIAQYALTQYEKARRGDGAAQRRLLAQLSYLERAQRDDGAYVHEAELVPGYGVSGAFLSAQAQGEAASALLRGYVLTSRASYLEHARRALQPLLRDTAAGGASYIRGADVLFEEVASAHPCHILNGHLYAAFGLWELLRFGSLAPEYGALHDAAVATLERWLPYYDADGWSCYDLAVDERGSRHYADLWYHQFHIAQLHVYAAMTQRAVFTAMASRWHRAMEEPRVRARVWRYGACALLGGARRRLLRAPVPTLRPLSFSADPQRT
jgi:hypothetical protein